MCVLYWFSVLTARACLSLISLVFAKGNLIDSGRKTFSLEGKICNKYNSYTMVCMHVRGDNPRTLGNGLSPMKH